MKVLIVDKSEEVIQRTADIVEQVSHITSITKASTYRDALEYFSNHQPDVVVLDMGLGGTEFIHLLCDIKNIHPGTVVIAQSIHIDETIEKDCLLKGADFFFDKYNDYNKIPITLEELFKENKSMDSDHENQETLFQGA